MLLSQKCIISVVDILTQSDFFNPINQKWWSIIVDLHSKGKLVDLITVTQAAEDAGVLDSLGGPGGISEIYNFAPSAANWKEYAQIVKEKSEARIVIDIAEDLLVAAYDPAADSSLMEVTQGALVKIAGLTQSKSETKHVREVMLKQSDHFEHVAKHGREMTGVPSGIAPLDRMTRGWQKGNLIVLAAATKTGKTSLAVNMAVNAAKAGFGVGIFSLEMNDAELGNRMIAAESEFNIGSIGDQPISQANCNKIMRAISSIADLPIYIRDESVMNLVQFRSAAHRMVMRDDVKFIVVDYAQLVQPTNKKDSREQQVAEVSRTMKQIAGELGIPIMILSQINDDGRSRESRALENDANVFMVVEKEPTNKEETEFDYFLHLKHTRDCPSGRIPITFKNEITKFTERVQ